MYVITDQSAANVEHPYIDLNYPSMRATFTRHLECATQYQSEGQAEADAERLMNDRVWMEANGNPVLGVSIPINRYPGF